MVFFSGWLLDEHLVTNDWFVKWLIVLLKVIEISDCLVLVECSPELVEGVVLKGSQISKMCLHSVKPCHLCLILISCMLLGLLSSIHILNFRSWRTLLI